VRLVPAGGALQPVSAVHVGVWQIGAVSGARRRPTRRTEPAGMERANGYVFFHLVITIAAAGT